MVCRLSNATIRFLAMTNLLTGLLACGNHDSSSPDTPAPTLPSAQHPAQAVGSPGAQSPGQAQNAGNAAGIQPGPLTTIITNKADAQKVPTPSALVFNFAVAGGNTTLAISDVLFLCKLGTDTAFSSCTGGTSYAFRGLTGGASYSLTVKAVVIATKVEAAADTLTFTARSVASPTTTNNSESLIFPTGQGPAPTGTPAVATPQLLQIGSFYQFAVPANMHVTEYATTKTYNGGLEFFQVLNDPVYGTNASCISPSTTFNWADGSGTNHDYCKSTPTIRDYKTIMTNLSLANNHLEAATSGAADQQYVDINVFDKDYEYMYGRTRFEQLCLNSVDGIYKSPSITVAYDFWGNGIQAQFVTCVTNIVLPNGPGLPVRSPSGWSNVVSVGALMVTSSNGVLPDISCFTTKGHVGKCAAGYSNPSLLEVTIVTNKTYPAPAYFASAMQDLLKASLSRIAP